jgi:hypothetical protein
MSRSSMSFTRSKWASTSNCELWPGEDAPLFVWDKHFPGGGCVDAAAGVNASPFREKLGGESGGIHGWGDDVRINDLEAREKLLCRSVISVIIARHLPLSLALGVIGLIPCEGCRD